MSNFAHIMRQKDTEQEFKDILAECRSLFEKKLHDYGASWRILRPSSLTDQLFIKAKRIRSLEIKGVTKVGSRPSRCLWSERAYGRSS